MSPNHMSKHKLITMKIDGGGGGDVGVTPIYLFCHSFHDCICTEVIKNVSKIQNN